MFGDIIIQQPHYTNMANFDNDSASEEAAEFNDIQDLERQLCALDVNTKALDITSTPSLDLGDILSRFTQLERLVIRTPSLELFKIPDCLKSLSLSTYDLTITSEKEGNLDLTKTRLQDLFFDPECDFSTEGDILLPDTLERFMLNRTCSSVVRHAPKGMRGVMVCENYPHLQTFQSDNIQVYE